MGLNENNQIRETRSAAVPEADLIRRGLPLMCVAAHPTTGEMVMLRRGVMGYFDPTPMFARLRSLDIGPLMTVDEINGKLGVTPQQREAMLNGSMFGFHCPGADPARHK